MYQVKSLVPILGILVAISPFVVVGENLKWGEFVLGLLIAALGFPLLPRIFSRFRRPRKSTAASA